MELFGRRYKLTLGTIAEVEDLRVAFRVERSLQPTPNAIDLAVYNLAPSTRTQIEAKKTTVLLEAGYTDAMSQIALGDVALVTHERNGPDWITHIKAGDGLNAYRGARISRSFGAGTALKDVLEGVGKAFGLQLGNLVGAAVKGAGLSQALHGFSASGMAAHAMSQLASRLGLSWSIQDGELQVLGPADVRSGEVVILEASTGLIGSPERAEHGIVRAKALLNGRLVPGSAVNLGSDAVTGLFRVEKAVHTGDTYGPDWSTEIESKPIDESQTKLSPFPPNPVGMA